MLPSSLSIFPALQQRVAGKVEGEQAMESALAALTRRNPPRDKNASKHA